MCYVLSRSVMTDSLWPHGLQPAKLLCPWEFFRQEYWSGLPCPPPEDLPNLGIEPRSPALQQILYHLSHQGSPRILVWVAYPFSRGSSWLRSPTLQVDSLPFEPPGKSKNSGVSSLSLLQGIFLTRGLLHCRWILYQLSYQGSPKNYDKPWISYNKKDN